MPRIKDFIKKNYVLCTVFLVIFIVCVASLIIIHLINTFKPHVDVKTEKGAYYQILGEKKYSFDAELHKENEATKEIVAKKYKLISISPIYYEDKDRIILTNDSVIILYNQGFKDYKLPKFSEVINNGESRSVAVNGSTHLTNNYFVYDANGTYIFMDEVTLKYNNKTVKLSPLSFVNASPSGLTYYNYETKEIVDVNDDIEYTYVNYENFDIDILGNIILKNNNTKMLRTDYVNLKVYKEA